MGGAECSEPLIPRSRRDDAGEDLAGVVAGLRRWVSRLEAMVGQLQATVASLNESAASRDERIAELEKLLEESRRAGKRQAAPFRHGESGDEPRRPGRKPGEAHGRHGRRMAPARIDRELGAPLPACCPDCGGEIEHVRDDEQFQTDLPALPPPQTTRF